MVKGHQLSNSPSHWDPFSFGCLTNFSESLQTLINATVYILPAHTHTTHTHIDDSNNKTIVNVCCKMYLLKLSDAAPNMATSLAPADTYI